MHFKSSVLLLAAAGFSVQVSGASLGRRSAVDLDSINYKSIKLLKRQNGEGGNNNGGGGASETCLAANAIQTGSAQTGQAGGDVTAGQVESATDKANFINFCAGQTLTNGLQVEGGSCNGVVHGKIPSKSNMVSTVIVSPTPGEVIASGQSFDISVQTSGLAAGAFTNAASTYYSAPQDLDGSGKIIGHCHVTVQDLGGSFTPSNALDPTKFAFFKGINDKGNGNGLLKATVTGGLTPGFYRVCTMNSAANHQPVMMPVAQRGAQDDCQKFEVRAGGAGGSGNGNGGAGGNNNNVATPASSAAASKTSAADTNGGNNGNGGGSGNGGNGNDNNDDANTTTSAADAAQTSNSSDTPANGGGNNNGGSASTTEAPAAGQTGTRTRGGGRGGRTRTRNGGGAGATATPDSNGKIVSSAAPAASSTAAPDLGTIGGGAGNQLEVDNSSPSTPTTTLAADPAATDPTATVVATTGAAAPSVTAVPISSGDLGGAAPPVLHSGKKDRPFCVGANTFVNLAAAVQRACDVQFNRCADKANKNALDGKTVADCEAQKAKCGKA